MAVPLQCPTNPAVLQRDEIKVSCVMRRNPLFFNMSPNCGKANPIFATFFHAHLKNGTVGHSGYSTGGQNCWLEVMGRYCVPGMDASTEVLSWSLVVEHWHRHGWHHERLEVIEANSKKDTEIQKAARFSNVAGAGPWS